MVLRPNFFEVLIALTIFLELPDELIKIKRSPFVAKVSSWYEKIFE